MTFKQFVTGRERITWVFAVILLYVFVSDYDKPWKPFIYLTNWCRFTVAISYFILWVAHRLNGDYSKTEYVAPDLVDDDPRIKYCCQPWKWGTLLYEWQLLVSLNVFIAFFIVELPFQMIRYIEAPKGHPFERYPTWMFLIGLFITSLTHAVPFAFGLKEFMSSSIRLRWEHVAYHYFIISLYLMFNCLYSYATDTSIYVQLDFLGDPLIATGLSMLLAGPFWFGSAYVYILLQEYKDTHPMTLTT